VKPLELARNLLYRNTTREDQEGFLEIGQEALIHEEGINMETLVLLFGLSTMLMTTLCFQHYSFKKIRVKAK